MNHDSFIAAINLFSSLPTPMLDYLRRTSEFLSDAERQQFYADFKQHEDALTTEYKRQEAQLDVIINNVTVIKKQRIKEVKHTQESIENDASLEVLDSQINSLNQ